MKKLLIITLFIFGTQVQAEPPPHFMVTNALSSQGHMENIPPGTNLQLVNHKENYDKWYQEVLVTDPDGKVLNEEPLRVSQEFINKQMKTKINSQLDFIDQQTGKLYKVTTHKNISSSLATTAAGKLILFSLLIPMETVSTTKGFRPVVHATIKFQSVTWIKTD